MCFDQSGCRILTHTQTWNFCVTQGEQDVTQEDKILGGGGAGGGGCLCMCNKNHGQHNKISNHNKIIFFIVTTKPLVCIQNVYSPCWKVPIWLLAVFVFWIIVQLDFKIFQPMKITFPCGLEASELNFGSRGPGLRPGWVIVLGSQTK